MKMEVDSTPLEDVQKGQPEDEKIKKIKRDIEEEKSPGFTKKNDQGVLWYKGRVCVRNIKEFNDKKF
jgi:restriction endonuclease S subunit